MKSLKRFFTRLANLPARRRQQRERPRRSHNCRLDCENLEQTFRSARGLRDLAAEKKLAFMQSLIGKPVEAITLNVAHSKSTGEFTEALTDNYQKLFLKGHHAPNCWLAARIEDLDDGALVGLLT